MESAPTIPDKFEFCSFHPFPTQYSYPTEIRHLKGLAAPMGLQLIDHFALSLIFHIAAIEISEINIIKTHRIKALDPRFPITTRGFSP